MVKVITYGTFDLMHYGHRRLLERAKALGDYLIVGVTSDGFDKARGKINVQQSLLERMEGVRASGLADEIIVEEYEGQKIDDIRRYDVDIFAVGSDWTGKFDYLREYCQVIYLPRTEGISSSEIRAQKRELRIGMVGDSRILKKFKKECGYVNGVHVQGICSQNPSLQGLAPYFTDDYESLLQHVDAVYLVSQPQLHAEQIETALRHGKHVLCESPVTMDAGQCEALFQLAQSSNLVLMEGIKTAYATAYNRLLLLVKSGCIGNVVSVDATCTSLMPQDMQLQETWSSICSWGPVALLPVLQILGINYLEKKIITCYLDEKIKFDRFTKIDFTYPNAVASIKIGKGVKSEGELVISGTGGYIYVPAPWWKMDYFELRFENPSNNRRYFYQLDGEGTRYEIVSFLQAIEKKRASSYIEQKTSVAIAGLIGDFMAGRDLCTIKL